MFSPTGSKGWNNCLRKWPLEELLLELCKSAFKTEWCPHIWRNWGTVVRGTRAKSVRRGKCGVREIPECLPICLEVPRNSVSSGISAPLVDTQVSGQGPNHTGLTRALLHWAQWEDCWGHAEAQPTPFQAALIKCGCFTHLIAIQSREERVSAAAAYSNIEKKAEHTVGQNVPANNEKAFWKEAGFGVKRNVAVSGRAAL